MKKQTAVELLKATIDTEVKLGTKMLINWDFYLSIERVELARANKLEILAKLLAKSWFYGNWEWENPNERIMQMLMQELGYYPFKDEDEMIHHTRVDDDLYKEAVDKVALINPRIMPVENHTVDTNEMIDHIGEPNKMVKQTAVEWLVRELNSEMNYIPMAHWDRIRDLVQRAKAMEREQIEEAYGHGSNNGYMYAMEKNIIISRERYYNETYKRGDNE